MQFQVDINGSCLLTLLDLGSTHNFINTEAAARVGIAFSGRGGLCVAVANGDRLTSLGCCRDMRFSIAGEFSTD
jgi:predicted aspartyl protease